MPCSISPWAISARSMRGVEPDRAGDAAACAWSSAMSARRSRSGTRTSRRRAEAMPAKAPTWIILLVDLERPGRPSAARLRALLGLARGVVGVEAMATANSSPPRRAITAPSPSMLVERAGDRRAAARRRCHSRAGR